ncbi:MAG: transposase [Candidatus Moraniibacteriota bacterium]
MRKNLLVNDEYYHIYNRGVDKRKIFLVDRDYLRFLTSMKEFNQVDPIFSLYWYNQQKRKSDVDVRRLQKLVDVVCYCLNPNHVHFILKQVMRGGISEFMKRLGGGYTKYFNHQYQRSGVLFQGKFKSAHIDSNEYLLYVSAYVNRNYFIHGHGNDLDWAYSSFWDYNGKREKGFCNKNIILDQFKNREEYCQFVQEHSLFMREKKETEKYLLE